ncbi:ADP-ribosylation factor-binding protein GGA1 isoform X2 [Loxodonta africana]|uniref:ADP-ribosylation factor-binding protein GGA1 isoform X2 n=1 Tax=Loxodonta africana TaxID=9785 RepID=UPI0030D2F294
MEPEMEPETLEARINRATNPLNKELNWASINGFCEQLNEDFEGPPLATRLLAHKIQSPQEWEALQALTVLETCMKSCGKRFHDEVGKFRFLNELIKVVSPKYLGSRTSEKVKSKVLELLYSWTVGLPEEVKIAEAYQMLKKQGIVKSDPKLPEDATFPLPPPRPKNVIFEDEEKSKMLARLLKSSHPEDLRAANKLIKEMVQEDQKRMEKISKRVNAIEEVNNNVKLLTEMVMSHSQGGSASGSSEDLMKELYQRCERMRPTLFRLASDTEDNDEALAEILQANDNLTQVINLYKQLVRGEEVNGDTAAGPIPGSTSALLDLSGLDLPPAGTTYPAMPTCPSNQASPEQPSASISLLDDELMSLGLGDPTPASGPGLDGAGWNSFQSSDGAEPPALAQAPGADSRLPTQTPLPASSGLDDLDLLGKILLQQSLPPESQQVRCSQPPGSRSGTYRTRAAAARPAPVPPASSTLCPQSPLGLHSSPHQPSSRWPTSLCPWSPSNPVMKVKLQPPSGTELPAFNPIVHPTAITQVLLLANPQKVRPSCDRPGSVGGLASWPALTPPPLCSRRRSASATSSSSPWVTRPTMRWGTWTSFPHLSPGEASRTEAGERRGQRAWPSKPGGGCGSLGHPLSPWPYTPRPGASPLTPVAPK